MPALVGAGTVVLVRGIDHGSESSNVDSSSLTGLDDIQFAPSGLVVDIARSGADVPVARGASATFHVGIAATTDVTRVELWQNGTIADIYEPTGDRLDLRPSLDWMPTSAGTYLITARATDADGRTGMSNPLWVDVTDTPDLTVLDADDTSSPGNAQPTAFAGAAMRSIAPFRQPFMIQTGSATQPSLSISDIRCGARLSAMPATSGVPSRLVLMTIPPGGRTMSPVAELEPNADGRADLTAALPTGTQAFVLAEMSDGLVTGWSPPVIANVGVGCATPGWSGELALVGGRLQAQTDVTTAYMYLQTASDTWTRVPAVGSVPRSASGFDFSSELPPLSGSYAVRAWGWTGGSLKYVGAGSYTPPGGSASSATPTDAVALGGAPYLPAPTLRWIERPAARNVPEVLSTHGVIDVDPDDHLFGVERFRWDVPYNGVTHAVVQVSGSPIPLKDGPTAGLGLFTCIVSGSGGEFQIDFDHDTCITGDRQSVTPVSATKGSYNAIVMPGVGLPFGQSPVSEVDPVSQLENDIYGDPESPSYDTIDWIEQRTVRVLPMTTDSWNGSVSNDVTFEIDRTPKAPPGEYAYDIDLRLVEAPRAPDFKYANCWQFVGWKEPGVAAAHAKAESAGSFLLPNPVLQPYYFWTQVTNAVSPLCAGCYAVSFAGFGNATVGLGGVDCSSSSSFWEDPVGWVISNVGAPIVAVIKEFVNLVSNGFAYLKSLAVEGLMELTGCTGKWCKTLAEAVVNGALIAIGVPPTLPNFDQLVKLGKGKLVDLAVDLAKAAGVPCDEAGSVADLADQPDLSCEAAVEALLDEVSNAVNENFTKVAASGGLSFHPDMIIKPFWGGQPGPAVVEVTVTPTKYTAEEKGVTCSVGVLSSAAWTAPSTSIDIAGVGTATIPQTSWQTLAYEIPSWKLPNLNGAGGYQPAKQKFTLYPPAAHDPVTVQTKKKIGLVGGVQVPVQVSPYTFYFHEGATFEISVGGPCARPETHTYTLDGSLDGKLVSVVEG